LLLNSLRKEWRMPESHPSAAKAEVIPETVRSG
jgi:hypothetical protein